MARRRFRFRWYRMQIAILVSGAALFAGLFGFLHFAQRKQVSIQDQLASIREKGYPTTRQELEEWQKKEDVKIEKPPESKPHTIEAAQPALSPEELERLREAFISDFYYYNDSRRKLIDPFLHDKKNPSDELLASIKGLAERYMPLMDWYFENTSWFSRPDRIEYGLNRFLWMRLRLATHRQDDTSFVEAIHDSRELLEIIQKHHNSYRIGRAIGNACHELQVACGWQMLSHEQLAEVRDVLATMECSRQFLRNQVLTGFTHTLEYSYDDGSKLGPSNNPLEVAARFTNSFIMSAGFNDQAECLDFYDRVLPVVDMPWHEIPPALHRVPYVSKPYKRDWRDKVIRTYHMDRIPRNVEWAFSYAIELNSLHRATLAMLAVEQYRIDTNTLPNALDELVPEYLDAVPHEAANGRPLQFELSDDGYRFAYRYMHPLIGRPSRLDAYRYIAVNYDDPLSVHIDDDSESQ